MSILLGFDFGTRKIGIAVGQRLTRTASPLVTLRHIKGRPDWAGIEALIREWCPDTLIVGLPLQMDDKECEIVPRVRRFCRQLEGRFRLPVHLADERLTTREAQSRCDAGLRESDAVDAIAAQLIIETWFCENDKA